MPGLTQAVASVLDRRLLAESDQPIALALSGGGDSVALALIASAWAKTHGRSLLILTVDHGLNPASADWTKSCRDLAEQLGADFQALTWTGPKPETGLPAAARMARHRLLADAARKGGASVILMGHTASDAAEAAAMRQSGSTTPDPREWAPSPVWPEGRRIQILRPMLTQTRADLRTWLGAQGVSWIEDPGNADQRFARSRARVIGKLEDSLAPSLQTIIPLELSRAVDENHGLVMPRVDLGRAEFLVARALNGIAAVCAGGGARLPRGESLDRLTIALRGEGPVKMTLAGCLVMADANLIRWVRSGGDIRRSKSPDLHLAAGQSEVWDGRYEVSSTSPIQVSSVACHRSDLTPSHRAEIAKAPAQTRDGLPFVLEAASGVTVESLVLARFQAAVGLFDREAVSRR